MKNKFQISIEVESDKDEIYYVEQKLASYNRQYVSADEYKPLNVFLREGGKIIGALLGETYWQWLHIRILWIDDNYRRQGFGKTILMKAENEAQSRNCRKVHLDTHDFQAEEFYKKNGYVVFGILDDLPEGHKRIYMKKTL